MRRIALGLLAALALLAGVLVVRTLRHRPPSPAPVEAVAVEVDAARAAARLAEAVRFRTISYQDPSEFPASEFEAFIAWVEATYPEVAAAMPRERLGGYSLLYRWPGSDPTLAPILLTGHYDVVPVIAGTESLWTEPPFAGVIAGDTVWGRGALDDKSAVVAQLEAASHLLAAGFRPARTVYLSFGHDEEVGGFQGAAAVAAHLERQGVRLAWSLDEGSFLFAGLFPGVEPLVAAINVAEKGSLTLEVVATAEGGHSSMPPRQTAVGRLAAAITRLEEHPMPGGLTGLSGRLFDSVSRAMPFGQRLLFANRWLFGAVIEGRLSEVPFGNAMLRTTTAPTMLRGSPKENVLPIEAVATVNFRLHPRDTVDAVIAHVRAVVESEHVAVRLAAAPGVEASEVSDWRSPGFGAIARAVREIHGEVVITPGLMIAASDSRHYAEVADDAFRFNPMVLTPEDLTGFHGTDEKIAVANLAQGIRTYVQILRHGAGPGG